ncbi:MAG TPA: hypothetical protein IGR89_16895 [Oscillatoriaceae cyanobacterium M7585_C2015_266]|nr:hypothetical protein [Oscillatoriaceae cyanobacterium M7585_C2015_266]
MINRWVINIDYYLECWINPPAGNVSLAKALVVLPSGTWRKPSVGQILLAQFSEQGCRHGPC